MCIRDSIWYDDIADLSVPKEMLPEKVRKVFFNKNATMMIAMFKDVYKRQV